MGLFDTTAGLVRRLPAGDLPARAIEAYGRGLSAVEGAALRLLAARLDAAAPRALPPTLAAAPSRADQDPQQLMSTLLSRSLRSNAAGSKREYYATVLEQLLPDEARIIAALADVPPAPLVNVLKRSGAGSVLDNASLIGRTAAVTLPSMTSRYVTHLLELGLVEIGPEDEANKQGYELILSERAVRAALKDGELSKFPARVQKRTLTLSAHGRELWNATRPGGDSP
jgi:hypothetical protein